MVYKLIRPATLKGLRPGAATAPGQMCRHVDFSLGINVNDEQEKTAHGAYAGYSRRNALSVTSAYSSTITDAVRLT